LPLKHLALEYCQLSEDAFKAIGQIAALEELWLANAQMKPEWLKHIAPRAGRAPERRQDLQFT
jgi:hypothetical protein